MTTPEPEPLWRHVALRADYPAGTCWAWMESAGRVCSAPEAPATQHLCARHATVARRKATAAAERNARRAARAAAETEWMRPAAEMEMATLRRRIARLDPPTPTDGAVVNVPLRKRMPTDAQISELAAATARLRQLENRFGATHRGPS